MASTFAGTRATAAAISRTVVATRLWGLRLVQSRTWQRRTFMRGSRALRHRQTASATKEPEAAAGGRNDSADSGRPIATLSRLTVKAEVSAGNAK